MAGYSGTPLWIKLGYKPGLTAYVEDAPPGYQEWLCLPPEVDIRWVEKPKASLPFAHLFLTDAAKLKSRFLSWRKKIAPDGVIWISWPKKSSGVAIAITENLIRDLALPTGLVDIKVCAVNEVWSGLKFMIRKELRPGKNI